MTAVEHYYASIPGWTDKTLLAVYQYAVVRTPEGGRLLEVGTWRGRSLSFLLVEALNSGKQLEIIGVDNFKGSVSEPALQWEAQTIDLHAECLKNCQRAGYPFRLIRADSTEAAREFASQSLDFVFLDGSHDFDSLSWDIAAWLPTVKRGGLLAGHDIARDSVRRAVRQHVPKAIMRGTCWMLEV